MLFLVGGRREASQAFAELLNDLEFDEHRPGLGADDLFLGHQSRTHPKMPLLCPLLLAQPIPLSFV